MQTLSIDIETYSDVNLSKCGVYKYAESPDFEILLFGYSADGSEVTVIDLAQGERLPQEIIDTTCRSLGIRCWSFPLPSGNWAIPPHAGIAQPIRWSLPI